MVLDSSMGQWETQFVGMYLEGFTFCSTFKPNITFSRLSMYFQLNLKKFFYIDNA
jgi:hypothetical protein